MTTVPSVGSSSVAWETPAGVMTSMALPSRKSSDRPAAARDADQGGEGAGSPGWHVAGEVRQAGGVGEAAADEQVVAGGGGGQPRPSVVTLTLGAASGEAVCRAAAGTSRAA